MGKWIVQREHFLKLPESFSTKMHCNERLGNFVLN